MKLPHITGFFAFVLWSLSVFLAGYALGWLDGSMGHVLGMQ